jgi:GDP-L-fucose synthase
LAAKVGGIKANNENQADFFDENILMNTNVIKASHNLGVNRVLSALSTCAFPDILEKYPFVEEDMLKGPPPVTNISYGYSKRSLHIQSCAYRNQYSRNYSTFCPSNLYGPDDNFDLETSHFVAALTRKIFERDKKSNAVEMWGTGKPKRQHLFVEDMAKIIPILLEKHNSDTPLIVAPDENLSILEACSIFSKAIEADIKFSFNGQLDGQYRKDGSNKRVKDILGSDFSFTPFEEGVRKTYEWYKTSRRHNI